MRLPAETRAEWSGPRRFVELAMSRLRPPVFVPAAAGAVLAVLALDAGRALETGAADTGLLFFGLSACVGIAAALAVGRWPGRRRMAGLILLWLFVAAVNDFDS